MTCDARLFQPSELSAKFRSGLIIFRPLSFLISARFFLTTVFIKNSRRAGLSFCSETSVRLSSDAGSHMLLTAINPGQTQANQSDRKAIFDRGITPQA